MDAPLACIVGCYDLHLYCAFDAPWHAYDAFPAAFTGCTRAEAGREARQAGWRINWRQKVAVCPECVRRGKTLAQAAKARGESCAAGTPTRG